ncbi:MAG: alpha/beta hydrolase [Treponema sp.]|jgi:pimeloyl-ACP methyl ester carboxylesterase|nr:alpha/beta hydrolase [Treponema sp.]
MKSAYTSREARNHVLSRVFNEMAIGSEAERHDSYDPREEQRKRREMGDAGPDSFTDSLIEELLIPIETGFLKGYLYRPAKRAVIEPTRVVIFFSGSAGSNPSMAGSAVNVYNRMGTVVVGVDYRGFGASDNAPPLPPLTGSTITESSLYQDGHRIYRYVQESMGITAAGVILHGFSLGGAVAARLAADIAEESARTGDQNRIGGLVLHSSIRTMTHAAAATLPLPKPLSSILGWIGGKLTGGAYDAASHLRRLAQYDPDIPIHFRGGVVEKGDALSLESTRLELTPGFKNATVYNGGEGHQSVIPGSKQGDNMTEGLAALERIVCGLYKKSRVSQSARYNQ